VPGRALATGVALTIAIGIAATAASAQRRDDRDYGYIDKQRLILEIDDCPPPPAEAEPQLLEIAAEHYDRGFILYYQGDYKAAIGEFVTFHCMVPSAPQALFTIGQSYERLLEFEVAIAYYERFVRSMRDDTPAIAEERRSVASRIQVLQRLPAQIQVTTTPDGATVSFVDDAGVKRNFGRPPYEVQAGPYTMIVELPGHETVTEQIEPRIGKPYSFYFLLQPRRGRLVVNAEPADARIFVEDRLSGIGRYAAELPGGTYDVVVEAPGRVTESRVVEVIADRDVEVAVKLPPRPTSGRTQLLVGSTLLGGALGSLALGLLDEETASRGSIGLLGGMGVGLIGGYFGIPRDISVGTSSFIITAGLIGFLEASLVTGMFKPVETEDSENAIGAIGVGGMTVGAAFAVLTAERFQLDAGDAALINSGALWGAIAGSLFAVVFESKERVREGLVLGGLNTGIISAALLTRQLEYSRRHVALIDLAGLAGMGIGVAVKAGIDEATQDAGIDDGGERTAHFALAGMALGLTAGAYLTRNLDVPRVTPVLRTGRDDTGRDTTTVGFSGAF
jgi:hypothetical protein